MNTIPTGFSITVLVTVTLIGGGCGTLAGRVYSYDHWWAGMIAGAGSGLVFAQVYLKVLSKLSPTFGRGLCGIVGTATGVGCGIAGAMLIQAVMILLISGADHWEAPEGVLVVNVLPFVFTLGIIFGAGVGFILGAICSVIHVYRQKLPGGLQPLGGALSSMSIDCVAQQIDGRDDHERGNTII